MTSIEYVRAGGGLGEPGLGDEFIGVSGLPVDESSGGLLSDLDVSASLPSLWRRLGWFVVDEPVVVVGLLIVAIVLVCALVPGLIASQNPDTSNLLAARQGPSAAHWFGTDQIGRDVFSRVVYGTRISLLIGIGATLVGALIGSAIGVVAGFVGGLTDSILMRCIDVLLAFPGVLLALAIIAIYGPGTATLLVAIGIISIPGFARVIRAEVVAAKSRQFVEAAVSSGATRRRLIFRYVLPNSIPPIIVLATVGVGFSLLAASSLSFLGLGPKPPSPEWGAILADGRSFLESAWWIAVFPGLAILLTVASINVVGQWLRERLDIRGRQ
jgi:peptide/nickel transport system permease protein